MRHQAKDANCTPLRQEVTQSHAEDLRDLLHGMHPGEMQTTQPQNLTEARTANYEDFVQKIEKLKDVLRSPSDRFAIHIIHVLYEMRYRFILGHSI